MRFDPSEHSQFEVRSYNGHYPGLSIQRREFDSPTHRQVMRWIGYCGWKGTATPQTGSIPVRCTRANVNHRSDVVDQCLLVSMGAIETNAKSESSLLRRIRARCMDLTVNQWLAGFDSQMRSKEVLTGDGQGTRRILARF